MTVSLDPDIPDNLSAICSRRPSLLVRRGLCAALLTLMLSVSAVAFIDWLFFLSDTVRWVLSLSAYAAVVVITWLTCLRWILRLPSRVRVARLIETAQPDLREDLISAVELGNAPGEQGDSTAFRSLLQQDVASRITAVSVLSLLPVRLIRRWLVGTTVAVAVWLVLLVWPRLHFGQRIGRAILPMADIERVALTKITIVSPSPASSAVPEGELVPVTVELDGPLVQDRVILETQRHGQARQQTVMTRDDGGNRRFSAVVRVDLRSARYRVRANDAQTSMHLINARQRP